MNVEILNGCIRCGICESINSEVFELNNIAHVNNDSIEGNEDDCRHAADMCPVCAIKITEDSDEID